MQNAHTHTHYSAQLMECLKQYKTMSVQYDCPYIKTAQISTFANSTLRL